MIRIKLFRAETIALIASLFLISSAVVGQEPLSANSPIAVTTESPYRVSILLCTPSQDEPYTIYGHAAMRVRNLTNLEDDYVYNFGIFDFGQPGFYYKFIKGETDGYSVQKEPWDYFLSRYHAEGQDVYELELDLSPDQEESISSYLEWNIKEENKYYLYNFAFDNCATRLYEILIKTLPEGWHINLPEATEEKTLRGLIDGYADYYPWYRLGTELALGAPADTLMTVRDRLFLPMEMDRILQKTTLASPTGERALVDNRIVYRTPTPAQLPRSYWWSKPVFYISLLLALSGVLCYRKQVHYWIPLWMTLYAIIGLVLSFLTFVSIHPCTDSNFNLLVFHPFLLLAWFALGRRAKSRCVARYFHSINVLAVALYLILVACAVQASSVAIILLALHSALLSIAYLTSSNQAAQYR